MLSNPTLVVKVPRGAFKEAVCRGVINEFLFWCTIKTINLEGSLKRGEVISSIKSKTGLSEANIRLKLSKLEKFGWLSRNCGSVSLSKYDKVWKCLGIVKKVKDGQKLYRVKSGNLQEIEDRICIEEMKDCLIRQSFQIKSSFLFQELGIEDTEKKPSVKAKIRKKILNTMNSSKLFLFQNQNILTINSTPKINYDASLSCLGTAKLFGYTSAMKGYLIQKKLKDAGLIKVERRIHCLGFKEFLPKELPSGCFVSDAGKVYKQLPNKITFTIKSYNNITKC